MHCLRRASQPPLHGLHRLQVVRHDKRCACRSLPRRLIRLLCFMLANLDGIHRDAVGDLDQRQALAAVDGKHALRS